MMPPLRCLLLPTVLLLAAACGEEQRPMSPGGTETDQPPNVLLVVVDTLRADHLGMYGYGRATSPYLDELAAQSVLFDACLVQWPKTGPSMAAMLSSTYGSQSGVARNTGRWPVPLSYQMLAEVFQDENYETMASVSNGSLRADLNYAQGFDDYYYENTEASDAAETISDRVREWLDDRDESRPFFVWAHYIDPHTPYHAPMSHRTMFMDDDLFRADTRGPVAIESEHNALPDTRPRKPSSVRMIPRHALLDDYDEIREYTALYDAEIRYFDDTFRELMGDLEADGHLENTIVIFTSDHGESLGDHDYYFEHGRYPYDACTRVPLFIRHPDWQAQRVSWPVGQIDILPTLLDSLGLSRPWQAQGQSLRAALEGGSTPDEPRPIFTESGYLEDYCVAVRVGPWKLIHLPDRKLRKERGLDAVYQMFNVATDPGETKDLFASENQVAARLLPVLEKFKAESYERIKNPDNQKEANGELEVTDEYIQQLRDLGYLDSADAWEEKRRKNNSGGSPEAGAGK